MPFIELGSVRLLYLHVPKTGGGSLESWLTTHGRLHFHSVGVPHALRCTPQHLRMADFRAIFGEGYFTHVIMTVRNPFDRIASEYRMRAMIAGQGFWKASPTFSHWLETNLTTAASQPFHLDNHLRPQWDFFGSGVEVHRYEDGLESVARRMAEILSIPQAAPLPRVHDTSDSGVQVAWDAVDRLRVSEFYRRDFQQFGYDPS